MKSTLKISIGFDINGQGWVFRAETELSKTVSIQTYPLDGGNAALAPVLRVQFTIPPGIIVPLEPEVRDAWLSLAFLILVSTVGSPLAVPKRFEGNIAGLNRERCPHGGVFAAWLARSGLNKPETLSRDPLPTYEFHPKVRAWDPEATAWTSDGIEEYEWQPTKRVVRLHTTRSVSRPFPQRKVWGNYNMFRHPFVPLVPPHPPTPTSLLPHRKLRRYFKNFESLTFTLSWFQGRRDSHCTGPSL